MARKDYYDNGTDDAGGGGGSNYTGPPAKSPPPAPSAPSQGPSGLASTAGGPAGVGGNGGYGFVNIGQYLYANPNSGATLTDPVAGPQLAGFGPPSSWNGASRSYNPSGNYTSGMSGIDGTLNSIYGRKPVYNDPHPAPGTGPHDDTSTGADAANPDGTTDVTGRNQRGYANISRYMGY